MDSNIITTSRTKNKNPSLNSKFYTKSELMGYYAKDINIILKNRNIWIEYIIDTNLADNKKLTKINFIISNNEVVGPQRSKNFVSARDPIWSSIDDICIITGCLNHELSRPPLATSIITQTISLDSLPIDCINIIVSGDIEIFAKMNAVSKTMNFINKSHIPLQILETVIKDNSVGHGIYKSRAQINSGVVWSKRFHSISAYMCIVLYQPNYLSKIYKSDCFVTHRSLVLEFLNIIGIQYDKNMFIETFPTYRIFCVPTVGVDLCLGIYEIDYVSTQDVADNLYNILEKHPERIVGYTILLDIIHNEHNNKNKHLSALFALIDHDASALIKAIATMTYSAYNIEFYLSLGTCPDICEKIINTNSRDIPKIFALSLEHNTKLLFRYICLVHKQEGEKGVRKMMNASGTQKSRINTKIHDIYDKHLFWIKRHGRKYYDT